MIAMPDTVLADVGVVGLAFARVSVPAHSAGQLCKGSCCTLDGRAPFSRLVYPAAQDAWLGGTSRLTRVGRPSLAPTQSGWMWLNPMASTTPWTRLVPRASVPKLSSLQAIGEQVARLLGHE